MTESTEPKFFLAPADLAVGTLDIFAFGSCFNVQVAFTMVDEFCDFMPKQEEDRFFNDVDVDIPYNKGSVAYRDRHYQGSADVETVKWDCCGLRSVLNFDPKAYRIV